jgi:hypothetical protein
MDKGGVKSGIEWLWKVDTGGVKSEQGGCEKWTLYIVLKRQL